MDRSKEKYSIKVDKRTISVNVTHNGETTNYSLKEFEEYIKNKEDEESLSEFNKSLKKALNHKK